MVSDVEQGMDIHTVTGANPIYQLKSTKVALQQPEV